MNPIKRENTLPGAKDWVITADTYAQHGEIAGYSSTVSAIPGATIGFAISTRTPGDSFTLKIYRLGFYGGAGARKVLELDNQQGINQGWFNNNTFISGQMSQLPQECATCAFDPLDSLRHDTNELDANWRFTHNLIIPVAWVTGYYVVLLTTAENKQSYIPFIVRNDVRATPYLMQASVATWQAYNLWGGHNLYGYWNGTDLYGPQRARIVSYNRPYAQGYGSGDLFFQEYNFVRYVESRGYDVSYTTNVDIAAHSEELKNHTSLIICGHDEYWDSFERTGVQNAVNAGLDLLVFSGNTAYKKIRYGSDAAGDPNREEIDYRYSEYQDTPDPVTANPATRAQTTGLWRDSVINLPENALLGIMWNSGQHNFGEIPRRMFVMNTQEWIFTGANLHDGDAIDGVVGYEYDTLVPNGVAPKQLITIADEPVDHLDTATPTRSTAILYYPTAQSFVFNAGTMRWSYPLDNFSQFIPRTGFTVQTDMRLQRVTQNILDAVSNPSVFAAEAANEHI